MLHFGWRYQLWKRGTWRERYRRCPYCKVAFPMWQTNSFASYSEHLSNCWLQYIERILHGVANLAAHYQRHGRRNIVQTSSLTFEVRP